MTSWRAARFALKHTIAAGVVIAAMAAFAAVSFVIGVVVMAARDSATAFPSMVLFALVAGVMSVVLVLAPITLVTEWLCQRARLRVWSQIPLSLVLLCVVGAGLAAIDVNAGASPAAAWRVAAIATAALAIPLALYWSALQSADWLLRTGGRFASRVWPHRFSALSSPEIMMAGGPVPVTAHFRIRDRVAFTVGRDPVLVIVGDTVDGVVRDGMQVFATRGTTALSATITSVEIIDPVSARMRLLLSPGARDLELWQAAATEGEVLTIAARCR